MHTVRAKLIQQEIIQIIIAISISTWSSASRNFYLSIYNLLPIAKNSLFGSDVVMTLFSNRLVSSPLQCLVSASQGKGGKLFTNWEAFPFWHLKKCLPTCLRITSSGLCEMSSCSLVQFLEHRSAQISTTTGTKSKVLRLDKEPMTEWAACLMISLIHRNGSLQDRLQAH